VARLLALSALLIGREALLSALVRVPPALVALGCATAAPFLTAAVAATTFPAATAATTPSV